ncbi:uncharacterized protein BO80DRAFT_444682 [Aspergillus ibericus CBS 121593]|uniref:Uncharacterized protein n=1 Tax=Aspergillus ibericus CBS 121593 TaxID=1448316 RepID=A0A395H0B1_9EURO|nr:hypothetical protein BO80DRAFT_444682 [Aspergillus ibericus CBS 121593]RAL01236.1 hypothetical protein BO80DRAFT_444682 [Aspergillus ibericus CBS 121593]
MFWTAEANSKLFVGVLDQMRGKLKLDYEALAAHMGSDCTACAVEQHIVKLKRQANSFSAGAAKGGSSNKSTPTGTPKKRQPDRTSLTPMKKVKGDDASTASSMAIGQDIVLIKSEREPKIESKIKMEHLA